MRLTLEMQTTLKELQHKMVPGYGFPLGNRGTGDCPLELWKMARLKLIGCIACVAMPSSQEKWGTGGGREGKESLFWILAHTSMRVKIQHFHKVQLRSVLKPIKAWIGSTI